MVKTDDIDKKLLTILQRDAKIGIKEIAAELNMSKTPIYERIRRLEREGIIDKYVAVLNAEKLDDHMVVFCTVSLENQKLEEIKAFNQAIKEIPEVLECYLMGGANDYLLKVVVKNLAEYHQFSSGKLAALKNISYIKSTFVLNQVKNGTVLPIY